MTLLGCTNRTTGEKMSSKDCKTPSISEQQLTGDTIYVEQKDTSEMTDEVMEPIKERKK